MLDIILLGFVGHKFYDLAGKYSKHKWAWGLVGVVSLFIGLIVSGFLMAIVMDIFSPGLFESLNETLLGVIALPFALLLTWFFYKFLKTSWEKGRMIDNANVLDDEMVDGMN